MEKTIFFGNGLNRLVTSNIAWGDLLNKIKGVNIFDDNQLPNSRLEYLALGEIEQTLQEVF